MSPNSVVFLDRDGVINHDSPDYVKHWNEFFFIPKSIEAVCNLTRAGFAVIIITNQSGIGRKLIEPSDLAEMHKKMVEQVRSEGGEITDIFYCPHRPEDNCACRKPRAGMLFAAKQKHGIDLSTAVMVGDSAKDIECGRKAGVGRTILVKTGDAQAALAALSKNDMKPDHIAPDLYHAAHWIITHVC